MSVLAPAKIENFALFVHGKECRWSFGDVSPEFTETCVGFLSGLDSMGQELFGEGVATIKLDTKEFTAIKASEIFVVSLLGSFFFIISDPVVTIKLIEAKGGIPFDVEEVMRGMLVGQASILYAGMFSIAESEAEYWKIDKLFQKTLMKIGIVSNLEKYVESGRCSFSPLSLTELLFFHYYIRLEFEKEQDFGVELYKPWGLLSSNSGTNISLEYQVEENITILAGYLSAIHVFITELFKSRPRALVFGGGGKLTSLVLFNGQDNFLSVANPEEIFKHKKFIENLNAVSIDVLDDILPEIKQFLAQKTAKKVEKKLRVLKLSELYGKYVSE
jgi:hypothetical protein